MNFNSAEFLVFLPITLLLFCAVSRWERPRDLLMLTSSYVFYMAWHWEYLALIVFSTIVDYVVGIYLGRAKGAWPRRALLILSLSLNLGLLCYFKYLNFFVNTTAVWFFNNSVDLSHLTHSWLLPVGISFYTFQTMSYTIDVFRGEISPEYNFIKFAAFVSFFPQLVAGPIVRAKEFLPQLHQPPNVQKFEFNAGLALIFQGLFKKIVIADLLAVFAVDAVFANPSRYSSFELLLALYGYAFQIYNDFSGYSDIAIGSARLFGITLPVNFNRPYLSQNIREFWTRWHISLSTWIRDYLYIPLGGNRRGEVKTLGNLVLTMVLAGLWHGAALNFVFWGVYHGFLLVASHLLSKRRLIRLPVFAARILCFHLIVAGWLLFRIGDIDALNQYIRGLAQLTFESNLPVLYLVVLLLAVVGHIVPQDKVLSVRDWFAHRSAPIQGAVYSAMIIFFSACTLEAPSFIYFQF